jgi:hypothetical protein
MKIKFGVRFMDWKPNDVVELPKERAEQYLRLKVAKIHKPPAKRKKAPRNKMVTGVKNK